LETDIRINYRQKFSVFANVEAQKVKDDYVNPKMNIGGKLGFKYFLTPNFNVEVNGNYFTLENENIVKRNYYGPEVNLEYSLFPKYRFSPYIYGGAGHCILNINLNIKHRLEAD
jgi:curli production assembly/transport component CsgG